MRDATIETSSKEATAAFGIAEKLQEMALVHRLESLNAFVACAPPMITSTG